jgi:hypothetical protein
MHGHDQKEQDTSKLNRRKFLTRAGTGLVIASLPATSVWASSNGLAGSIIASGHGSDFARGFKMKFESPGYFMNTETAMNNQQFESVFGGPLIDAYQMNHPNRMTATLGDVLNNPGSSFGKESDRKGKKGSDGKLGGTSNINFLLVGMYLNAVFSGDEPTDRIYYPIAGPGRPFADPGVFAKHIYNAAQENTFAMSSLFGSIITTWHN